jgi:hypothetical protein
VRTGRLLLALALACACGRKAAPVAPQLVQPEPAEALAGVSTPEGVRLTWLRPLRYSGGGRMNDLEGFDVERATDGGDTEAVYFPVGEVTLTDQTRFKKERRIEWLDTTALRGTKYRYRVTAKTLDGYRSPAAGPVVVQFGAPAAP